jgi:hypothetical protein
VTGICTVGDTRLLPLVLDACENYTPMSLAEQENSVEKAAEYPPLFA